MEMLLCPAIPLIAPKQCCRLRFKIVVYEVQVPNTIAPLRAPASGDCRTKGVIREILIVEDEEN